MRTSTWVLGIVAVLAACGDESKKGVDAGAVMGPDRDAEVDSGAGDAEDPDIEAGPGEPDTGVVPDSGPEPDGNEGCIDRDRDGAYDAECGGDDCNDDDAAVGPSAVELCGNGVDDDCDDSTPDERDADGDGTVCTLDCDDEDPLEPQTTGACAGVLYYADFEGGPRGWKTSGENSSWALGAPAKDFIEGAASGVNAWVTGLAVPYNNNEYSYLTSPTIDISALTHDPVLMLSLIFDTEYADDMLWVEYAYDGGDFHVLGHDGEGFGWYTTNNAWAGTSEGEGVWHSAFHVLEGAVEHSDVRLRFAFKTNYANHTDDGVGIDDVRVLVSLPDVSIQAIQSPPAGCEDQGDLAVGVDVLNLGNETFSSLTLAYEMNEQPAIIETFDVDLAPGDRTSLTFTEGAPVAEPGEYHVAIRVADDVDAFAQDDTTEVSRLTLPAVSIAESYHEDFESSQGGWFAYGENVTWRWGVPNDPYVSAAASGERAWYSQPNDSGADETAFLQSPCFDFSTATSDPVLHMALKYRYVDDIYSSALMEISTNGGRSWTKLGEQGSGGNWYTDDAGWTPPTNTAGQWRTVSHRLTGAAGTDATVLRYVMEHWLATEPSTGIDDVRISTGVADLAVEAARVEAEVGCSSRNSDVIIVGVQNRGNQTVSEFDVSYTIDGGPPVTERVTQAIAPGAQPYEHRFELGSELAAIGEHVIEASVSAVGDPVRGNDSLIARSWTQQIIDGTDYEDDFEADDGEWLSTGQELTWAWSNPESWQQIPDAASGERAWITGPEHGYAPYERSHLTSPCFDLTAAVSDPTFRFMHIIDSDGSDSSAWLEISIDGGEHFTKVGNSGTGTAWYESPIDDVWTGDPMGGLPEDWHTAAHVLPEAAGQAAVMVRFVYDVDASQFGSSLGGHGVDDVSLVP